MKLFKLVAGLAMACLLLSVAGCTTLLAGIGEATTAVATAQSVVQFANAAWSKAGVTLFDVEATYGVIQTAMTKFEGAECPKASSHSWCPTLHDDFAGADKKVRTQFANGENFIAANPTLSPSAIISAAEAAVNAAAAVADSNGVKL